MIIDHQSPLSISPRGEKEMISIEYTFGNPENFVQQSTIYFPFEGGSGG